MHEQDFLPGLLYSTVPVLLLYWNKHHANEEIKINPSHKKTENLLVLFLLILKILCVKRSTQIIMQNWRRTCPMYAACPLVFLDAFLHLKYKRANWHIWGWFFSYFLKVPENKKPNMQYGGVLGNSDVAKYPNIF